MKRTMLMGVCALVLVPWMLAAQESAKPANRPADAKAKPGSGQQVTCPVSGKPVNPDAVVEYEGQKVLFCCKGCPDKFKAEPMKYLPAVYKQIYPQSVQTQCPVMGGDVDPKVFTEYEGRRIGFCCKGCDKKFAAAPAKYMGKLPAVSTEQVHCPVSGHAISAKASLDQDGKKVYFCCTDCIDKYKADPAKYAEALRPTAGLLASGKTIKDDLIACPTCTEKGVTVKRGDAKIVEHAGMNYALCGDKCVATFKADPAKYAKALRDQGIKSAGGPEKAFTCSMHPDVVRTSAGKCPLCAMDLKPVVSK